MPTSNDTTLSRQVTVTRIPSGEDVMLESGTEVIITQALGGSYTLLIPSHAGLYRLEGKDADAIGRSVEKEPQTTLAEKPLNDLIWDQLKTCFDPEIPVNIVDLGLIYDMTVSQNEQGGHVVDVKMTLTAPGCGMGPVIASEAQRKIISLPGVAQANVDLIWDPPWSPDRISDEGKQKLGII